MIYSMRVLRTFVLLVVFALATRAFQPSAGLGGVLVGRGAPTSSSPSSSSSSFSTTSVRLPSSSASRRLRLPALHMSSKQDDNPYYRGQDAYQILEVPRTADKNEIKKAYRKAVATWHPDKFPDDEEKKKEGGMRMEKINRAWFCLGDDDRKRRYDQFGEQGVGTSAASEEQMKAGGGSPFGPGMGGMGGAVDVNDISDIFDAFFGGAVGGARGGGGGASRQRQRNPNAPIPGDDMQVDVEIPFMTAIFGGSEKIKIRRLEECGTCTGSGVKPGSKVSSCSTCGGQGVVNNMQRTPFGVFNNVQTCPNCRGSGQEIDEYCPTCKGKGATFETRDVIIRVPAGVEAGVTLRVRDSGNAGKRGGPRGDLFVQVSVKRDPKFRRDGIDIFTDEEISYVDAILGTTIKADTVDGKMDVKIPAGVQPDQKIRLRGKGAPKIGSETRGDAFMTVKVKIPQSVSGKEKELIEQIAELNNKKSGNSSDTGNGFFSGFGGKS